MNDRIRPEDLKKKLEDKPLTIIDVRSPEEYAAGHVAGARNIPIDRLEASLAELPKDQPVVPYCNMFYPGSSRGERATALLQTHGFEAQTLEGGFPAWRDAALPVDAEAPE